MKFKIKKSILLKALGFAYKPVLAVVDESLPLYVKSIHITATKNEVSFYGTNSDTLFGYTVKTKADCCEIEKTGKCLLYAKTFFSILKKYTGDDWVECEIKENSVIDYENGSVDTLHNFIVQYKKSRQNLGCDLNFEWPVEKLKIKEISNSFNIPSEIFSDAVNRVLFACGNNSERMDLKNLCIQISDKKIYFVATSGPNLAVYESSSDSFQENKQILIRKDAIPSDKKLLDDKHDIVFYFGLNYKKNDMIQISHNVGDDSFDIYAKPIRIKGPNKKYFPNWEALYESRLSGVPLASVSKTDLYESLDRLCVVSPFFCVFSILDNIISFSGGTQEKIQSINCNFYEAIENVISNKNITLCLNSSMFRDSIKNINGKTIDITLITLDMNGSQLIQMSSKEDPGFVFILNTLREEINEEHELSEETNDEEVPF